MKNLGRKTRRKKNEIFFEFEFNFSKRDYVYKTNLIEQFITFFKSKKNKYKINKIKKNLLTGSLFFLRLSFFK